MADSKLIEAIEKLVQIRPSDPENSKSFVVKSYGIQSTVKGSFCFEAAIKFAYFLPSLNLLSSKATIVEDCEAITQNVFVYRCWKLSNYECDGGARKN